MFKSKKRKIIFAVLTFMLTFIFAFVIPYSISYYTSVIELYTVYDNNGGSHRATIGMNLSLLFDEINSNPSLDQVAEGQSLRIPYKIKLGSVKSGVNVAADGTISVIANGSYADADGNTVTVANGVFTAKNSDEKVVYTAAFDATDKCVYYTYNSNASWGSPSNPYLISDSKHLQNLSVLQNIGYFEDLFIKKTWTKSSNSTVYTPTTSGKFTEASAMPYFLVTSPDGKPTTINGEEIKTFTPVGNDVYPFIGYLGGNFIEGTTTVANASSRQSAIYKLTIKSDEDQVDCGLFGTIGYLGDDTEAVEANNYTFAGVTSTFSDILLCDISVVVKDSNFKKDSWAVRTLNHLFSFQEEVLGEKEGDINRDNLYHENHHIGIAVGHVEYATIEYISVYYSDMETPAIDLKHLTKSSENVGANYSSVSGILGFVHDMNCESGNNEIKKNGTSNSDLRVESGGIGSGGGELSGMGRGYISASAIFENYNAKGGIYTYIVGDEQNQYERNSILVEYKSTAGTVRTGRNTTQSTNYFLEDGTPVLKEAGTDGKYKMKMYTTYQNFFGITQYQTTEYENVVILKDDQYYALGTDGAETLLSQTPKKTAVYIRLATDEDGNLLCTQYIRDRIIAGTQATDMYYFYDGVFTFALSSASDTIDSTWNQDSVDKFGIGLNSDSEWYANYSKGAAAAVAIVKPITSMTMLNSAISASKKLLVVYSRNEGDFALDLSKQAAKVGNYGATIYGSSIQNLPEDLEASLKEGYSSGAITKAPTDGSGNTYLTVDDLKYHWDDYTFYYFGTTSSENTFDELINTFVTTVVPDESTRTTVFSAENGSSVQSSSLTSSSVTYNSVLEASYDGYFIFDSYTNWDGWFRTYYRLTFYNSSNPTGLVVYDARDELTMSNYKTSEVYEGEAIYKYNNYEGVYLKVSNNVLVSNDTDREFINPVENGDGVARWENLYTHTRNYILQDNTGSTTKYYAMAANGASVTELNNVSKSGSVITEESGALDLYTFPSVGNSVIPYEGILISKDYSYTSTFSHGSNYLQMDYLYTYSLRRYIRGGSSYTIWNGADASSTFGNYFRSGGTNVNANLFFNYDKTVSISYTTNNNTRYLSYGDNNFTYKAYRDISCRFNLFEVDAMDQAAYGRITYEPKDATIDVAPNYFNADEFILWPEYGETKLTGTSLQNHTVDPTYTIKQLQSSNTTSECSTFGDVLLASDGWKNSYGQALTKSDLHQKFTMGNGVGGQDTVISIGNGTLSFGDNGILSAPIGSTGEKADIPTGCVAFRINQDAPEGTNNRVRIIIAVPISEFYYGEQNVTDTMDYTTDYYLGLFHMAASGDNLLSQFSFNNAREVIELPRSFAYDPKGNDSGDVVTGVSKYIIVNYDLNGDGTKEQCRCYLNGDRVLVGYEFIANEEGVYLLATNHPMEVVYFSADATSSEGRDGVTNYKLGTIDFVYSNTAGDNILTVKDASGVAGSDYENVYYASLTTFYTNNAHTINEGDTDTNGSGDYIYPNVNDFVWFVQRKIVTSDGKTNVIMYWKNPSEFSEASYSDSNYIDFVSYSFNGDQLINYT